MPVHSPTSCSRCGQASLAILRRRPHWLGFGSRGRHDGGERETQDGWDEEVVFRRLSARSHVSAPSLSRPILACPLRWHPIRNIRKVHEGSRASPVSNWTEAGRSSLQGPRSSDPAQFHRLVSSYKENWAETGASKTLVSDPPAGLSTTSETGSSRPLLSCFNGEHLPPLSLSPKPGKPSGTSSPYGKPAWETRRDKPG